MAGYIFSLSNIKALNLYTRNGVYATILSDPKRTWRQHHEGTFADYSTMEAGDNIYFFINRKIYGIGQLVDVEGDCKYFNYPQAGEPRVFQHHDIGETLLWDEGEHSTRQRCVCFFRPDPHFFRTGVDMDDVLSSNPSAFKMLRAFWKLSFIKFDDDENQAFRDIILKRNQNVLPEPQGEQGVFKYEPIHGQVARKLGTNDYRFGPGMADVLSDCADGDRLRHEMAIEAGLLHQLAERHTATCGIFGEWDYLSHQVIASPFKPVDYMDKMDLFGYAYLPQYRPTKARFLVGEIKKDAAGKGDVDQLLKYVDWVRDEYCYGDYSMIRAFLIAQAFDDGVIAHAKNVGNRQYTVGVRPAQSLEWNKLSLVDYSFDATTRELVFHEVG